MYEALSYLLVCAALCYLGGRSTHPLLQLLHFYVKLLLFHLLLQTVRLRLRPLKLELLRLERVRGVGVDSKVACLRHEILLAKGFRVI